MSKFIEKLVDQKVRVYFNVYDKNSMRYDITGVILDYDESFVKLLCNEKIFLISVKEISFIEYKEE